MTSRKPFELLKGGMGYNIDGELCVRQSRANQAIEQDKIEYLRRLAQYQMDCEKQLALYEQRINTLNHELNTLKKEHLNCIRLAEG